MFFSILLFIATSIKAYEDQDLEPTPVPISVGMDMMEKSFSGCNTDIACNISTTVSPQCGEKCWANAASHYFRYKFVGEMFQVYASRQPGNGKFNLLLDGSLIKEIDLQKDPPELRTLVYTSDLLEYGEHTIEARGIGQQFEIYKFSYWPSIKAKRLNVSDFQSSGNWVAETDKIGGIRQYTNNKNAKKYLPIHGSRFWIYGSKSFNHGNMTIKIGDDVHTVSQESSTRVDAALIFDSKDIPFNLYTVSIENQNENSAILFYCLYYISEPPKQTLAPHPSRTLAPDTATDYINKKFVNTITPNPIIRIPDEQSSIKQVSGCTFTNIKNTHDNQAIDFMIQPMVEILFYDNTFEYTDPSITTVPVMWTKASKLTFTACTFKNFRDQTNVLEGTVFSVNLPIQFTLERCNFINCGRTDDMFLFKMNSYSSSLRAYGCTFSYDSIAANSKICNFKFTDIVFDGCTFIKCGDDCININPQADNGQFQFTNNVVEGNNETFIQATGFIKKPVISGNIFRNINMETEYLISITHGVNEIELFNNTFSSIVSFQKGKYCGGATIWVQRTDGVEFSLLLDQCKFYDITNNKNTSPFNQGGAIQYGYTTSIAFVEMTLRDCEFKRNNCQNGMGGALGININHNLTITGCIFEDNIASTKGGAIYIWCKIVKPTDNADAPDFDGVYKMKEITIFNCQFIGNKATENGAAIFVERENIDGAKLYISGCTFTDNGQDKSKWMIYCGCPEINFENIKVEYLDESKTSGTFYFKSTGSISIHNSSFIKSITQTDSTFGYENIPTSTVITITNSEFNECRRNNGGYTIWIPRCLADFDNVTVSFASTTNSNGGINFENNGFIIRNSKIIRAKHNEGAIKFVQASGNTNPITISNCIFDECGVEGSQRGCFSINKQSGTTLTFENNVIQNMKSHGGASYIGVININNQAERFTIRNLTLINNECNSYYGGGSGLWIDSVKSISFEGCSFINNVALSATTSRPQKPGGNDYYPGDGGGIQYGFTSSIYNIELTFTDCLFRENKAVRHGGAIGIQMNQKVEIINCNFESNVANYQARRSTILYENYFDRKTEGRGGAIYINPTFTYTQNNQDTNGKTPSVLIEGCTFRSNRAYDGYAIYIEGEDSGTSFIINNNDFIDNYDPNTYSLNNSIITSEIMNLYEGKVLTSNRFSYTDPNVYVPELLYVNHFGIPPSPSSTPIKTGANLSESTSQQNNYNLGFDCVLDRGSVKVFLTCDSCAVNKDLYFTVSFEDQEIHKITHDSRLIYPATNPTDSLDKFVLPEKIILNKHNNSLSFHTGSSHIKYDRVSNNIKCYVPLTDDVFKDGDCSSSERCEKIIDEPRPVHVFVEVTQFNNFNESNDDGGAIHLINCCLTCTDTPFTNCVSKEGGGGAIYIKNELDYTNNVTLTGIAFTDCQAKYGGAVYIYSSSIRVKVQIKYCTFTGNHLIDNDDSDLKGGSAIFLNCRDSKIIGCQFSNNYGSDSACRILTSFKSNKATKQSLARKIGSEKHSIIFNECVFKANSDAKSLIHFTIGNGGSELEVNRCIFTGVLSEGAHFIDEQILDMKSPLLKIKACKFSYDFKRSLNLDPRHDLSLIDLNDQVFNYSEVNESKQSSSKLLIAIVVPAVAVVSIIVVVLIIVHKKKHGKEISEDQENAEITTNLIDTSLI